MKKFDFLEK